jgi:hypothetical protein
MTRIDQPGRRALLGANPPPCLIRRKSQGYASLRQPAGKMDRDPRFVVTPFLIINIVARPVQLACFH